MHGAGAELASFRLNRELEHNKPERKYVLMKTADMMVDFVRAKNAFRVADPRIPKVQQSRYERRKVRECLRLGHWAAETA
jgi:hypothetical protein